MIIIGVDPGTIKTGYGIIMSENSNLSVLNYGLINLNKYSTIPERLNKIFIEISILIKKYNPSELSIETAFYGKNIQSALKLGYARGVAILAAYNNNVQINEYSPREVKKSVVGNGGASKEQVNYMVKKLLEIEKTDIKLDVSDALALALCHSFRIRGFTKKSYNWKKYIEEFPDRIIV